MTEWQVVGSRGDIVCFTFPRGARSGDEDCVVVAMAMPREAMRIQGLHQAVLVVLMNKHPRPSFALDTTAIEPTVTVLKERFKFDEAQAQSLTPHLVQLVIRRSEMDTERE